ncbi:MAG: dipeptide/oligopeptide/nickel ABC transporter permease/ATP-binding protein [Pseudomonadales bacterium]|nr:dipeptide/oligopeptide/nickel ABC transporter permease/ATP-binding protein [Pseudomonadales bacterium]
MSRAATGVAAEDTNAQAPLTGFARTWRAFLQHRLAVIAAGYLLVLACVAIFGQALLVHDPLAVDLARTFEAPSAEHWLGTDHLGRSTLGRLVVATSVAMQAACLGVGIAIVLGAPLGLLSGYFGGWWDRIGMRLVEAIVALPALLVPIAILAILGPSLTNAMIALGIANSTAFFRLMRGAALEVREELYVDAARVSGSGNVRIVFRHVLPNVTGPLIVQTTLAFSYVLLAEAGLSFIGLGVQPPESSWGVMLATAQRYVQQQPFLAVPPGLMIMFTVLAFNLLGDGVRDALSRAGGVVRAASNPGRVPGAGATRASAAAGSVATATVGEQPASGPSVPQALLSVTGLEIRFRGARGGELAVVSDVSFDVPAGRTIGLVGESGCGKSVTAMSILGLLGDSGRIAAGSIRLAGQELVGLPESALNGIRGASIGMIFQEPMTSLNPAYTVGNQIAEVLVRHAGLGRAAAAARAVELLDHVGIPGARQRAACYPHEFSGGMAQRAMIAMAIACEPKLLIADEPTTALDVTIQEQVLDLLSGLQEQNGMSILLITHDLGVVADMCDEAVVMYAGNVVEQGRVDDVLLDPRHPYTAGLLASMPQNLPQNRPQSRPRHHDRSGRLTQIPGRVPPAWAWPAGCRFHPRCPYATEVCRQAVPQMVAADDRRIACVRAGEIDPVAGWRA